MSVEIKVPAAGESISEVYIGQWNVAEGAWIEQDASVVELESDKATFQLPAPVAGIVTKILKAEGESAQIGDVIGHMEESERPAKEESEGRPKQQQPAAEADEARETPSAGADQRDAAEPRIMPAAARLLAENKLDADQVSASGPGGRLLKEDVLRHLKQPDAPAPTAEPRAGTDGQAAREERAVRMSPIRKRIAERLVAAQQSAALLTTFNEIDMTEVMQLRRAFKERFQDKYGVKLGFMSFFVKAAVDALNAIPQVNASIDDDQIVYRNYCDIGIAIGSGKGLVVPILRNAEHLSFAEIELAIDDLGQRAQNNQIKLEELQGGTFTISNGGVYGSLLSTPIVNPPQSGVLGMHAIQERPVGINGEIQLRPMMYVALTYDHRLVDGREAVTFLRRIKDVVEQPSRMLLEI